MYPPQNYAQPKRTNFALIGGLVAGGLVLVVAVVVVAVWMLAAGTQPASNAVSETPHRPPRKPSGRFEINFPAPPTIENWDTERRLWHQETKVVATGTYTESDGVRYEVLEFFVPSSNDPKFYFYFDEGQALKDFYETQGATITETTGVVFGQHAGNKPFNLFEIKKANGRSGLVFWIQSFGCVFRVSCVYFSPSQRARAEAFMFSFRLKHGQFAEHKLERYVPPLALEVHDLPTAFWVGESTEVGLFVSGGPAPYRFEIAGLPFEPEVKELPARTTRNHQRWSHSLGGVPTGPARELEVRIVVHSGDQRAEHVARCAVQETNAAYEPVWVTGGHSVMIAGRRSSVWHRHQPVEGVLTGFRGPVDKSLLPPGTEANPHNGLLQIVGEATKAGHYPIRFDTEYYFHAPPGSGKEISPRRPFTASFDLKVALPGESLKPFVGPRTLFLLVADDFADLNMWPESVRPEVEGALVNIPEHGSFNLATVTWHGLRHVFEAPVASTAENVAKALDRISESEFTPKAPHSKRNMLERLQQGLPEGSSGYTHVVLVCPTYNLTSQYMKHVKPALEAHARAWAPAKLTIVPCGPLAFDSPQAELTAALEAEGASTFYLP